MSAARANHLDTMAPPVARTIQGRSLVIGLIFAAIAMGGAFLRPEEFFRGYLLALHGLAGRDLGIDGDPDDPPLDGRRLGHGDSADPGRGHALRAADDNFVRADSVWASTALHLGAAAGFDCRQTSPRALAGHHEDPIFR